MEEEILLVSDSDEEETKTEALTPEPIKTEPRRTLFDWHQSSESDVELSSHQPSE